MAIKVRIEEQADGLGVEVEGAGSREEGLMRALRECQEGRCTCPTDEYRKLAGMEVTSAGGRIRLRLRARAGERFDKGEVEKCLDYSVSRAAGDESPDSGQT